MRWATRPSNASTWAVCLHRIPAGRSGDRGSAWLRRLLPSPATGNFLITKYTAELRFPVSLNPSATIYTTVFVEAGNTWSTFDNFDPFKLYRSAGLGLRLFLPMFGPMGLDYGWRLDDVPYLPNMAKSQFHFTIGIDLGEL